MPFETPLKDFNTTPLLKNGKIQRKRVVLVGDLVWIDPITGEKYTVPSGFVNNLASFPWFVGWALVLMGRHMRAAVLHDWLSRNNINDREWADMQLRRAATFDDTAENRVAMLYYGARIGGWKAWKWPKPVLIVDPKTMKKVA